jgi:hypothetical protein
MNGKSGVETMKRNLAGPLVVATVLVFVASSSTTHAQSDDPDSDSMQQQLDADSNAQQSQLQADDAARDAQMERDDSAIYQEEQAQQAEERQQQQQLDDYERAKNNADVNEMIYREPAGTEQPLMPPCCKTTPPPDPYEIPAPADPY